MRTLQLVLVRHGFSLGNERQLLYGWMNVPLAERGRAELRQLRDRVDYPSTQRYISSDLCRCTETFAILYEGKARLDALRPDFREIFFGSLEGKSESQVSVRQFFRSWLSGGQLADEERFSAFRDRIESALMTLVRSCQQENIRSVTLITHSGVIRTLLLLLNHWGSEQFPSIPTPNGLGYVLELEIDGPLTLRQSWPLEIPSRCKDRSI